MPFGHESWACDDGDLAKEDHEMGRRYLQKMAPLDLAAQGRGEMATLSLPCAVPPASRSPWRLPSSCPRWAAASRAGLRSVSCPSWLWSSAPLSSRLALRRRPEPTAAMRPSN